MRFLGHIDIFDNSVISGWFLDKESPDKIFDIEVFLEGELLVKTKNDIFREDVESIHGSGNHGFHLEIYSLIKKRGVVEVKVKGVEFYFQNSSKIIDPRDPSKMVKKGEDGWIFLVNDSNAVDEKIQAKKVMSENEFQIIINNLEKRESLAKCKVLTYIVPDRNVFLNRFRSDPINISENRDSLALLKKINSNKKIDLFYGYDIGGLSSNMDDIFLKNDTHVTDFAFYYIYQFLMAKSGIKSLISYSLQEDYQFVGDLGLKFNPPLSILVTKINTFYDAEFINDEVAQRSDFMSPVSGCRVHFKNKKGNGKRCLVFGTSSGYFILKFFFSIFSEVKFFWSKSIDYNLVREYKPDVIYNIFSEKLLDSNFV